MSDVFVILVSNLYCSRILLMLPFSLTPKYEISAYRGLLLLFVFNLLFLGESLISVLFDLSSVLRL